MSPKKMLRKTTSRSFIFSFFSVFLAMTVSKDPRYAKYFQMVKVVSIFPLLKAKAKLEEENKMQML